MNPPRIGWWTERVAAALFFSPPKDLSYGRWHDGGQKNGPISTVVPALSSTIWNGTDARLRVRGCWEWYTRRRCPASSFEWLRLVNMFDPNQNESIAVAHSPDSNNIHSKGRSCWNNEQPHASLVSLRERLLAFHYLKVILSNRRYL